MSNYLPFENILYRTQLSQVKAIERLADKVEKEKSFRIGFYNNNYTKPYYGTIYGSKFEINRALSYRNSFSPIIKGEIFTHYEGTRIKVSMKPHVHVLVFMTIWFGAVFIACFATIAVMFTQGFNVYFLIPFAMLLFGVAFLLGGFKTESKRSRNDLKEIFQAEID